jgi:hypothetical protein
MYANWSHTAVTKKHMRAKLDSLKCPLTTATSILSRFSTRELNLALSDQQILEINKYQDRVTNRQPFIEENEKGIGNEYLNGILITQKKF